MAQIRCLLWDFGDTLCDETFIWHSGPEWREIYATFDDDGLGAQWSLGRMDTQTFAVALAKRMDRSPESVIAHMTDCCRDIEFFDTTYAFFKARHLPQAIVTVNPDLFSKIIVPMHNLDAHCDTIVTSWQEGSDDKRILSQLALTRLGLDCGPDEALLIDNKKANIDAWQGIGGAGYHYRNDQQFAADAAQLMQRFSGD